MTQQITDGNILRWEGYAADSRVLHDANTRSNGLKVPIENYYLCDGGYTQVLGIIYKNGIVHHLYP
ncbi:hypothetical protein C2S52_012194 [Perilla frutescens var. hirtella]|nr:hypothetical protein C2S52_012194 [Perilla frutescens var. hirtella]